MRTLATPLPSNDAGPDWPLFVISLRSTPARRDAILKQCSALGLVPRFIDAVDGRNGLPVEYEARVDRAAMAHSLSREASDAECACAVSHQFAYEVILAEGHTGAIILEDDAILTPHFATFVANKGYRCADLIMMNHDEGRAHWFGAMRWSSNITLMALAANARLTSGYTLTRRAARYILDHSRPIQDVADWPCDLRPLKPRAALPRIVTAPCPSSEGSLIAPGREANIDANADRLKNQPRLPKSTNRFLTRAYWRRWYLKRMTRAI